MKRALKFFSMLFFIATISFVILTTTQLVASGMTEQEMVERDTELVTVPSVAIGSFPVATKSVYGNIITWESDNENIIFMDGWFVVKRQVDVDINATITVTVTRPNNPEISAEETFDILVPKGITVRNEYSITYHNVEDTTGFKTSYLLGDETYELPTPTKDGFLFDGWYTTDTFEETTKIEKIVVGSKTNFELYAKWKVAYAEYKVVHRFEQLDSSFEETLIETKEGLIGSEVSTDTPTYPGFQLEEASSMTSGIVREDGQLKLVVVYLRKTFTLTVVNGTEEINIPVKFGAPIELEDPVKAGYEFKGWENIVETMPANDLTVTAKWEAIDVDYTVEFYFEALDGSFVLDATKTQALQAKTDSSVTAPTPAFAGFTFKNDHPDQVLSAVVEGDESTVLKVFYTRNTYTLTVFLDEHGMNDYELDLKYGQPIVLETPTRVGYDFNGWWNEVATMPAEDHRMVAMWTPALVDYQIQYYLETLTGEFVENVNERVQSKELTEEYIYATIKTFTGFTFDESNPKNKVEGEVLPDGSLVLKVYYTRNTYTLTVKYDNGDPDLVKTYKYGETISVVEPVKADYTFAGWEPALPSTMPANDLIVTAQWSALPVYVVTFETQGGTTVQQQNVIEGKTVIVPTSPTKIGYTFVGWFLNPTDETPYNFATPVDSNFTLYAKWTEDEVNYTVKHFLQDLDGENYTEVTVDEQTLKALTGSTVTATPNSYTGFTFDVNSVDTGTVLADGSLVINLYYKRNTYTITIKSFGEVVDTVEFLFGEEISLDDLEETGFDFDGWVEQLPETMPAENLTVNAKWTAIEVNYTVKHFRQDLDGENYTEVTTDRQTLKALTGSTVTATPNSYTGFTFDVNSEVEGTVLADGTLVIELFYTRNKYIFTIMDGAEVYYSKVLYFEQFLDYPYPEKAGYTWGGFEEGLISNMPAEDLTLNLIWHANEQTYYVKHYIEQIDGTYVLYYPETLTAYTEEVVEANYISIPNHIFKEDHPDNVLSGIIPATGNLELSVYYEIISVTLTFNSNGGTSVDPITAKVEEKVELPTPTRTGYTFVAWLDEIGNEVDLEDGLFTIPSMNCTLTAKWEAIEYSIEYYFYVGSTLYDGAFNNPNANKYTIEYGVNLLEPDGFDSEYFFVAWYTDLEFKDEATGIETGSTGTKVFYGLLKSYAEAFEEDIDILLDTYSEVLAGTVTTLEPLTLTLPNGTVVSWQSDDTAIYVNPLTGEVTITRPTDADHIVVITAMLTLGDHYYNVEFVVVVPKGATYVEEVLYSTEFENAGTKTGYAQGTVKIDEVDWTLTDVLIGSDSNDAKEGSKSLRGRPTGTATLLKAFENVSKIAFKYATYGSDSGVKIQLQISKDGEDWVSVFEVTPSKHILEEANVVIDYNNSSISSKGITASTALNIRFYITGTSGKRVNIDDFSIYSLVEVNPDVALINEDLGNIPSQFENVIDVFTLPTIGANGSTIVWSVLNGNAVTIEDNVVTDVTRPASNQEDAVVTLLATVSLNGLERTKEVTVTVLKLEKTNADKLAEDKAALEALSGEIFAGATFNLIETTTNGASVTWFANPSNLIDEEGVVGAGLVENAVLTLTATLTLGEDEVTAVVTLEILAQIEYGTVGEARSTELGEELRVKGIVTAIIGRNIYIQDETAGINVFLASDTTHVSKFVIGNEVGVIGTLGEYGSLLQVTDLTHVEILSENNDLPEPIEFASIDMNALDDAQGQLVTVNNLRIISIPTIGTSSYSIPVTDGTNQIVIRIDSYIADYAAVKSLFQGLTADQIINVVGVPAGRYNADLQIMVSKAEQIVLVELTDQQKVELAADEIPSDLGIKEAIFTLPTTNLYGVSIEWSVSSGSAVNIVNNQVTEVRRPSSSEEDVEVILQVLITLGEAETVRYVTVTIAKEVESGVVVYAEDLFISEYIEGSSNNKAIEIFNGTGQPVDLSNYTVKLYANGATTASQTLELSGELAHGEVYVIYHGSSAQAIKKVGDLQNNYIANFNGDDAIELLNGTTRIDIFGEIGNQIKWGENVTLVRKSNITSGNTVYDATEWTSYPSDTFTYLGTHTFEPAN